MKNPSKIPNPHTFTLSSRSSLMADQGTLSNPNPSCLTLCDECGSNPWKYRCPGCSLKSCSLPCVKSHKARTSCNGKRTRTEFVPLSKFDDNLLVSDYNLLEETKRVAESSRRMAGAINGFRGYIGFRLPKSLLMLRNAANRRGTKLLLLPPAMSKRQTNQSRYDRRKNSIFWTIEWRFHLTDVVLVDNGVDEHASLFPVIAKHLAPSPLKNQLSPYRNVQIDDIKFFLRKTPKGPKSPFRELNIEDPIGRQLTDVVILEYPVIFVFLPSHSYEFEVEKDVSLSFMKEEPPGSLDSELSPKGNLFIEEEIEGEVFTDTVVTDLRGCINSVPGASIQIQRDYPIAEKGVHVSDMQISREAANGLEPNSSQKRHASMVQEAKTNCCSSHVLYDYDDIHTSSTVVEGLKPIASPVEKVEMYSSSPVGPVHSLELPGDAKFDFQQELRDAYSDLVGEINPDDFLCLDDGYNEPDNFGGFLGEEELEEGEIPDH